MIFRKVALAGYMRMDFQPRSISIFQKQTKHCAANSRRESLTIAISIPTHTMAKLPSRTKSHLVGQPFSIFNS